MFFLESGSGFGKVGANYVRMNVATNRRTLKAGLDSMAGALKISPSGRPM